MPEQNSRELWEVVGRWFGRKGVRGDVCYNTWADGRVATLTIAGDIDFARYQHVSWNISFRKEKIAEEQ